MFVRSYPIDPLSLKCELTGYRQAVTTFCAHGTGLLSLATRNRGQIPAKSFASATDPHTGVLIYGNLPDLPQLPQHTHHLEADVSFLQEVCNLEATQEDVEAALFWRLKTGKSIAELYEDVLYRNLASLDGTWLLPHEGLGQQQGNITSLITLPGGGKTLLCAHIRELGDNITLDSDAVRYYLLSKLTFDADAYCYPEENTYMRSQHMYGPTLNKLNRLTLRALASGFAAQGIDVIVTGFAASDISHDFIWIEQQGMPFKRFLELSLPSSELLETLLPSLPSSDTPFSDLGFPDLQEAMNFVHKRVHARANRARASDVGDYDWRNPFNEYIINRHTLGANPKMSEADIARVIVGIQETMLQRLSTRHQDITFVPFEEIPPESQSIPGREFQNALREKLAADMESDHFQRHIAGGVALPPSSLIHPSELILARQKVVLHAWDVLEALPDTIRKMVLKVTGEDAATSPSEIKSHVFGTIYRSLTGMRTGGNLQAPHRHVLEKLYSSSPNAEELVRLFTTVLTRGITTTNQGGYRSLHFDWQKRFEPSEEEEIPAPAHTFTLLYLADLILGDTVTDELRVAILVHELLEESTYHTDTDGKLLKGRLYGEDPILRGSLLEEIRSLSKNHGNFAAAASDVMTEVKTSLETKELFACTQHLFTSDKRAAFLRSLGNPPLRNNQIYRGFQRGPLLYTNLDLQKVGFIERLIQKGAEEPQDPSHLRKAQAIFAASLLDRLEDTLTLDRYFHSEGTTPPAARARIIAYTARLLFSHAKLCEAYDHFPESVQADLAPLARAFLPALHQMFDSRINPELEQLGEPPIEDEDLYRFYWDYFIPQADALTEVLTPRVNAFVDGLIETL